MSLLERLMVNAVEEAIVEAGSDLAESLRRQGVAAGEAIVVRLADGQPGVAQLLGALAAGARPVLVAPEAPAPEVARVAELAAARAVLDERGLRSLRRSCSRPPASGSRPPASGSPPPASGGGAVGLLTSGSTGQPKLVWRSEGSLRSEGERYRAMLRLTGEDHVVLPLSLCHAYALGWLAAALVSGTRLTVLAPKALGDLVQALERDATAVALVPELARLLVRRHARAPRRPAALRVAMVGAGPVDRHLDEGFHAAFGLRLARNYGSTEMGAVLSGEPPLPPLSVGRAMPGVEIDLGADGALRVKVDGRWHETGDIAVRQEGAVTIVGRRSAAARRGGRWVAPAEVEQALLGDARIADARVVRRPGPRPGEDRLLALVVPARDGLTPADVQAAAAASLAPYKRPDKVVLRGSLDRSEVGKLRSRAIYRRTAAPWRPELASLARALERLGVLAALDGETDTAILSADLGLPLASLELALAGAAAGGLVAEAGAAAGAAAGCLALDLGASKLALRLGGRSAREDVVIALPELGDARAELDCVLAAVSAAIEASEHPVRVLGLAAAPALDAGGRVATWPNRPHWVGLPLGEALRALGPSTVVIEDDGAAAALAEASVRRERRVASVSVGTGIGGGVTLDGVLDPAARELGHVVVDPAGPPCACGRRGCVQAIASGRAILLRAGGGVDGAGVERALARGEAWAEELIAPATAALVALLERLAPDVACIGGGFAAAVPSLLTRVSEATATAVVPSAFGAGAALEGAFALAARAHIDTSQ